MLEPVTFTINFDVAHKEGLSISEVLFLLYLRESTIRGRSIEDTIKSLIEKEKIACDFDNTYKLYYESSDLLDRILMQSDKNVPKDYKLEDLAKRLMDLYPSGKKEGTNYYWKGNKKEVIGKLQKFYKYYGKEIDTEDIYNTTKAYVESFNGDYRYMRLLKYFILKQDKLPAEEGGITQISDLATFLENKGQDNINNNWTTTLV